MMQDFSEKETEKTLLQQIEQMAELSNISLSKGEKLRFQEDFQEILLFAEQICAQDLDQQSIGPMQVLPESVLREDQVEKSLCRAELLKNAPCQKEGFIVVPKTMEE